MDLDTIKVGILGFGSITQATVDGFLGKNAVSPDRIYVYRRNQQALSADAAARGIHTCGSAEELVRESDVVIVGVNPNQVEGALAPVKDALKDKIVLSVVGGYFFDRYEEILPAGTAHLTTIPNVPISVGEGITIFEEKHSLSEEQYALIKELFERVGVVVTLETGMVELGCAVAGCTPAFAAVMIEAMGDAAVKYGMDRETSYRIAGQVLAGTGKMEVLTGQHPGALKDSVTSPGGTTILGVTELAKRGFSGDIVSGIDAIMNARD